MGMKSSMAICHKESAGVRSVINTKSAVGRDDMESTEGMHNRTYAKGTCVAMNNNTVRWSLTANKGDHALETESTEVENTDNREMESSMGICINKSVGCVWRTPSTPRES